MRKKRKKAAAVLVDGIVHAIGQLESEVSFVATSEQLLRRNTRWQHKEDRAHMLRTRHEPRVRLLCDEQPRMISMPNGTPFRMPPWRAAPRTHAQINCMACLVALGRT